MKPNLTNEPSELAQNFIQIASFMQNRANTRLTLKNKNSLSNLKNFNNQNTKEKNSDSKLALQQIFAQLAEQLNEGHTILTLDTTNPEQNHLYQSLKHSEWVHKLDNSQAQTIDKPIIMQARVEHSINEWGETEMAGRVVVWLHRQWFAEHQLARQLLEIAKRPIEHLTIAPPTPDNANKTANERQQLAINNACQHALSIITGGPGTGKTFTVAQLVIALQHAHNQKKKKDPHTPPLSIALTAPTGKAAQRMEESLSQSLQGETVQLDKAKTLHRLLGIGSNGMSRYHHANPLPDDLVIVDEASMLGLELASQLVDAIKPTGRLILLGDANQLSAVDAGAVLADLCEVRALQPYRTELTESRRFDDTSAVGQLALTIKQSADTPADKKRKISEVKKQLKQKNTAVTFYKLETSDKTHRVNYPQLYQQLGEPFGDFFALTKDLWENPLNLDHDLTQQQVENLFQTFDTYRILSAGHHGKLGDVAINQAISQFHKRDILKLPLSDSPFYHGQPIMMLKNDYQLGVFNGDIGICLKTLNAKSPQPNIVMFPHKVVDISRLNSDSCTTAYALTIHKSQGSEFHHVAVCLDGMHARLLSQELIYTAVTRSKEKLDIYSNELVLNNAIVQKGNRQTGLALQFDW